MTNPRVKRRGRFAHHTESTRASTAPRPRPGVVVLLLLRLRLPPLSPPPRRRRRRRRGRGEERREGEARRGERANCASGWACRVRQIRFIALLLVSHWCHCPLPSLTGGPPVGTISRVVTGVACRRAIRGAPPAPSHATVADKWGRITVGPRCHRGARAGLNRKPCGLGRSPKPAHN